MTLPTPVACFLFLGLADACAMTEPPSSTPKPPAAPPGEAQKVVNVRLFQPTDSLGDVDWWSRLEGREVGMAFIPVPCKVTFRRGDGRTMSIETMNVFISESSGRVSDVHVRDVWLERGNGRGNGDITNAIHLSLISAP
ncbi:MAG: hypothetical protein M3Q75_10405 [Gemmatimonadota bacterium]|nr:hypothetical protein [Gemmatimonadota bacterium]